MVHSTQMEDLASLKLIIGDEAFNRLVEVALLSFCRTLTDAASNLGLVMANAVYQLHTRMMDADGSPSPCADPCEVMTCEQMRDAAK